MKSRIIKNFALISGTSNLAFASATSGKVEDEKLEDKEEFKGMVGVLKNIVCKNIKQEDLAKEIFSKFYKCTKTENKKLKKNILNYTLNSEIKIGDVKDFFKSKIKIAEGKKNVIVLKKNPIIVPILDTEEKVLESYSNLLKENCIILELGKDGTVEKLYNTTVDEDKKELSDKIKEKPQEPEQKPHDTKEIFESVLKNTALKENKFINIIELLNKKKLEYGLHDSNDYNIELNGYIVIDIDGNGKDMLSETDEEYIKAKIRSNISSIEISGAGNKLSPSDVIIAQKKIDNKQKLLIAKAEDVKNGKIGDKVIDSEFYKSGLEKLFSKEFIFSDIKEEKVQKIFKDIKDAFIKYKIDKGIYDFNLFEESFKTLIKQWIIYKEKPNPVAEDIAIEWNVLENSEKGIGICYGTGQFGGFEKDLNKLKEHSLSSVVSTSDNLNENSILFVINGNKFMVADINDIANGKVNGQTIDESFYKPNPSK